MRYRSTKRYGHEIGLSTAFRQWRAESHCKYIHGYALAVKFTFESEELDHRGWVCDFGGFKSLKSMLEDTFDHKLIVAQDDPAIDDLTMLDQLGLAQVIVLPHTGCERFAEYIYGATETWLDSNGYSGVTLVSVEVSEHGANSAIYTREEC
jgi:6-pyruvoyltetrahydropterin/6-carboxytetrahydropterin synthase